MARTQQQIQHALLLIMAWRRPGDKPLSEAMMVCGFILVSSSSATARCRCPPGYQTVVRCTATRDAICVKCPPGTYHSLSVGYRHPCIPCRRCGSNEFVLQECTNISDTVCGSCSGMIIFEDKFRDEYSRRCQEGTSNDVHRFSQNDILQNVLPSELDLRNTKAKSQILDYKRLHSIQKRGLFQRTNDSEGRTADFNYSGLYSDEEEDESHDFMDKHSSGGIVTSADIVESTRGKSVHVSEGPKVLPYVHETGSAGDTKHHDNSFYTIMAAAISALIFFVLGSCLGTFIHKSVARRKAKRRNQEEQLYEALKSLEPLQHPRVTRLASDELEDTLSLKSSISISIKSSLNLSSRTSSSSGSGDSQLDDVFIEKAPVTFQNNRLSPNYLGRKPLLQKPAFNIPVIKP